MLNMFWKKIKKLYKAILFSLSTSIMPIVLCLIYWELNKYIKYSQYYLSFLIMLIINIGIKFVKT